MDMIVNVGNIFSVYIYFFSFRPTCAHWKFPLVQYTPLSIFHWKYMIFHLITTMKSKKIGVYLNTTLFLHQLFNKNHVISITLEMYGLSLQLPFSIVNYMFMMHCLQMSFCITYLLIFENHSHINVDGVHKFVHKFKVQGWLTLGQCIVL